MSQVKKLPRWTCNECGFSDRADGWLLELDELTREVRGVWCPKCKLGGKIVTKSAYGSINKKEPLLPEAPKESRVKKVLKAVAKASVPIIISILWSLSNIASYHMGQSAGRAKELAESILNAVAQDAYAKGVDAGYFKGLDKANEVLQQQLDNDAQGIK